MDGRRRRGLFDLELIKDARLLDDGFHHRNIVGAAAQRGLLEELHSFEPPPADVLDVVTFADMTTSPSGEPIDAQDRVDEILTRYAPDDPVFEAVSSSTPQLLAAVVRVAERLRRAEAEAAQPK